MGNFVSKLKNSTRFDYRARTLNIMYVISFVTRIFFIFSFVWSLEFGWGMIVCSVHSLYSIQQIVS